jgi:HAE1 family hydrophobic/amphiphilic exporter-1
MIAFFAKHPTAANLLMLIMLAAGTLSLSGLRRETMPDAMPVEVEVSVVYPGATAREVEESIIDRLENALEGVQFIKEMRGVAMLNVGSVKLKMTDRGNYVTFRNEIDNAISSIDDFPLRSEAPVIRRLNTKDRVLEILVSGPLDAVSLKAYCEQLKDRLLRSAKISDVEISGFSDHLLRVEMSREALLRYGLSPSAVSAAITNQSIDLPAGRIESEETALVRVKERRRDRDAMERLVVAGSADGGEVLVRDIATVRDEFELDEDRIDVNGQRGAVLAVLKPKSEDMLDVAAAAQELLKIERQRRPQITLSVINDQSILIEDRIGLLLKNGVQGCILVFITMWFFFSARLSFWVIISLPVSFLAGFALVPWFGLTINMLTMVGLLMALGLLMDDGIVIAENIARRRSDGESGMTAAIHGVREVASGVFSSFLTTSCVLGPLIFLSGELGRILRVMPMMLLLVLAASLIEAFLILPSHLGHSLEHVDPNRRSRLRLRLESLIDAGRDVCGSMVGWTVRWRYLTLGLVVMTFMLTVGLIVGGFVRGQVFPDLEGDTIEARVLMPPGTPLRRTKEVVGQVERALRETNAVYKPRQPDQRDLVEVSFARFNHNIDAFEAGPHVATFTADLLATELRDARLVDVVQTWRKNLQDIPDALSLTFDEPAIGPQGRAIEIQLSGLSLDELEQVSRQVQDYLRTFAGTYNLSDDLRQGERELLVQLRPGGSGLGLTANDVAVQLRGSFQGLLSDQIQVGTEGYDVEVRFEEQDRDSREDLETYLVFLPDGQAVPLSEIATVSEERGWSRIAHYDAQPVVTVIGNVDSMQTNAMGILSSVRTELMPQLQASYPELEYAFKGEAERGAETGSSLARAGLIGCLGVFIILSFQFRSYVEPLIVMAAIPFALVGVIWGHLIFGLNLSLPSVLGYASLAGVVVNDSILLVLFLKQAGHRGVPVVDAAINASRTRFRAVMITSLTTIAGLSPLMLERSLQAQILIPIAISICFGLLASTVLVLLVIPALYVMLHDLGLTTYGKD